MCINCCQSDGLPNAKKVAPLMSFLLSLSMLVSFRGGGGGSSGGGVCFRVTRAKSHFTIFT